MHKEALKKLGKKRKVGLSTLCVYSGNASSASAPRCGRLCLQDEADRRDVEITERHAREVAALNARVSSAAGSPGSSAKDGVMQLGDSLYKSKLSHDKV